MTFSILMHDPQTGGFAAAAATGSLCVGGWVLRGDIESGLVASQGTAPSTFWRDDGLRHMYNGRSAAQAVEAVTQADTGRHHRQMLALDRTGQGAGFTGRDSIAYAGHRIAPNLAVAGNMLSGANVLDVMQQTAQSEFATLPDHMLAVLDAAAAAGGDTRGLQSAALLVLRPDHPPLDLRIDFSEEPLSALRALCIRAHRSPYFDWLDEVPTLTDRSRAVLPEAG
ncbi:MULTISPECIES: DUF1028 domain-containing protein [unclassified Epibacterium]|uniref:DUF1028 domain-containing protein n=1 Tax=unclassified Epibacterium TaxID=2639179 RepID=UPI001EF73BE4|nr:MULTISPECIES: DUF1028 domain-containing protein [unclassified Epibacterium]MCG7624607.1 DUF1028 domain-containing protein [Epibacterium sp. Ofav1-8]MCG7627749.1 DUF1028 domain-containing protein [Epibacterium sp. MM17-32]